MEPKDYSTRDEGSHARMSDVYLVAPGRTVTYRGSVLPAGTEVAHEMANLPEFTGRVIVELRAAHPVAEAKPQGKRREAIAGKDE